MVRLIFFFVRSLFLGTRPSKHIKKSHIKIIAYTHIHLEFLIWSFEIGQEGQQERLLLQNICILNESKARMSHSKNEKANITTRT